MKKLLQKIVALIPMTVGSFIGFSVFCPVYSQIDLGTLGAGSVLCLSDQTGDLSDGGCDGTEFTFSNFASSGGGNWNILPVEITSDGVIEILENQTLNDATFYTFNYRVTAPAGRLFSEVTATYSGGGGTVPNSWGNFYSTSPTISLTVGSAAVFPAIPSSDTANLPGVTFLDVTSSYNYQSKDGDISLINAYNSVPVPWETDALPLVGATALFAGAVWWKRRRSAEALDLSEATPDPEQMTDIR